MLHEVVMIMARGNEATSFLKANLDILVKKLPCFNGKLI